MAPLTVGQTDHNGVNHLLVLLQHRFHLSREHILTAGDNHVAAAVGKVKKTVSVQIAHVAHALKALGVRLDGGNVFIDHIGAVGPAHIDAADLPCGEGIPVIVTDGDLPVQHPADAAGVFEPVIAPDAGHADALGHGVHLIKPLGGNNLKPLPLQIGRADAAGVPQDLDALKVLLGEAGQLDDPLHQGGHHLNVLHLIFLHQVNDQLGVKAGGHDQRVATVKTVEGGGMGRAVKQRAGQQLAHFKIHAGDMEPGLQTIVTLAGSIVLLDDLGLAGGAAGAIGHIGDGLDIRRHGFRICLAQTLQLSGAETFITVGLAAVGDHQRGGDASADLRHVLLGHLVGHRHIAAAGFPDPESQGNMGGDIGQCHHNTLAGGDPFIYQVPGDAVGELLQAPPGHHRFLVFRGNVDNCGCVRLYPGDIRKLSAGGEKTLLTGVEDVEMLRSGSHKKCLLLLFKSCCRHEAGSVIQAERITWAGCWDGSRRLPAGRRR